MLNYPLQSRGSIDFAIEDPVAAVVMALVPRVMGTAVQEIVGRLIESVNDIVSTIPVCSVFSGTGEYRVDTRSPINTVIATATRDRVGAGIAVDRVVAQVTNRVVLSSAAFEDVMA